MTLIIVFTVIIFIIVINFILKEKEFRNTTYYKNTKNSLFFMNKGQSGEYDLFSRLEQLEKQGAKFLFNLYLPMGYNRTTEIDMVMLSHRGIFVFESKNYSGWIFGNEHQSQWTVVYKGGRKERLVNPIKQNNLHIQCLRKCIDIETSISSVVVFSENCTLKKVTVSNTNVIWGYINNVVDNIISFHNDKIKVLSERNIQDIYNVLYPMTKVDKFIVKKHIADIRETYK